MNRHIHGGLFALATATLLAACASSPQVKSGANAPATAASPPTAANAPKQDTIERGWRRKMVDGKEVYCQRQPVTGSRANVVESCLTLAEIAAKRESSQEFLRRTQTGAREMQGPANAGAPMSAVNPPGYRRRCSSAWQHSSRPSRAA